MWLCLFLLIRADEQEKLSSNNTTVQNGTTTQELNIDFYLGIYGGNTKMHFLSTCCVTYTVWIYK